MEVGRPRWLPWSVFPFQGRFADVGDERIHYIDEGSGLALPPQPPGDAAGS
jgi:hypothetical protein